MSMVYQMKLSLCVYAIIFILLVTYIIQIFHNIHVDLLSSSCVFVTNVIQSCHDISVDLLQSVCVFVTSVIYICANVYMDL